MAGDDAWHASAPARRHPLGWRLAPANVYAEAGTGRASSAGASRRGMRSRLWPVFVSVLADLCVNAYTEPAYSTKRFVHVLAFSLQVCSLLMTVTSFVVLVGGNDASALSGGGTSARAHTSATWAARREFRAMFALCAVTVLTFVSSRVLKLVLLFGGNPFAAIAANPARRALFASHQLASAGYYAALVQSAFVVCRDECG